MLFALSAIFCASTAFGQYYPQPVVSPQQNWNAAAANTGQQAINQNTGYATIGAPVRGNVGCDARGGCGNGCDGRGGCGLGGGCGVASGCGLLGGGLGGGCGLGGGGGFGGGCYDPCRPMKYFSFYGGQTHFEDVILNLGVTGPNGPVGNASALIGTDDDLGFGGAVGRSFGRRFRGELDFTYRKADVEYGAFTIAGGPGIAIPLTGDLETLSFMPNLLFDLNPNGRFNAYFGVGAGVSFNELTVVEPTTPIGVTVQDSSFAYQGIIGLSACVSQRADLFFEYRYFATDEWNLSVATPIGGANASVDITSHNYFVGLRIKKW